MTEVIENQFHMKARTMTVKYRPNVRVSDETSRHFAGRLVPGSIPADWLWRIDGQLYCIGASYGDESFSYDVEVPATKGYKLCGALVKTIDAFPSTAQLSDMSEMFAGCHKLERITLKGFDTRNVTSMRDMFKECSSLRDADLSRFDTRKVTDMSGMFAGAAGLVTLNLSSFDTHAYERYVR